MMTASVESQTPKVALIDSVVNAVAGIKENYGNKLIYIDFTRRTENGVRNFTRWVVFDPHHSCTPESKDENQIDELKVVSERKEEIQKREWKLVYESLPPENEIGKWKLVPEMCPPDYLDLSKMLCCSPPVYINSKLFIIGGKFADDDEKSYGYGFIYSPKVFMYDFSLKKWEEGRHHLRCARAHAMAVAIGSVIYVFGGRIDYRERVPREKWCEFYDLESVSEGWQLLKPPPQFIPVESASVRLHAVHERGNEIILWMGMGGAYSFNYITKEWTAFDLISNFYNESIGTVLCHQVAVVEDVLFSHYFGVIYAHDLSTKKLLFSKSLHGSPSRFGEPKYPGCWPVRSYLLRVGLDTLCLVYWDHYSLKKAHCYRFRIQKSSSLDNPPGECVFDLLTEGCGFFEAPGAAINRVTLV